MKMLSLFSGIGGIDLAASWAGIETAAFCEIEPFCQKVLKRHWANVPLFDDIKKLSKEVLENAGISGIDIVAGGFPCQPFSIAGKQQGTNDDRYLWPEMLRIINEIRPTWVIGENVENAVRIVLDDIIDSMENIGYKTQTFVISAYCTGAYFDGKRTFIVATPNDWSTVMRRNTQFSPNDQIAGWGDNNRRRTSKPNPGQRRPLQSRPYGVADGIPNRVDRNNALGNAVVPQQIYPIFKAIMEVENAINKRPAQPA
ncbi:DNA cytosine methyltransferase [Pectinatus frisingensis]|uniref:DNA cytosine methyltransferase n=1 Tax=Pectinatus frisingensis TaxID=865 RepID=UPI003D808CFA